MKQETIKQYIRLREDMENLAEKIFDYVYDNYKDYLEYHRWSMFDNFSIDNRKLWISYEDYHDVCKTHLPEIPIELLDSEAKWKKFIDKYYKDKIKKEEEKKKRAEIEKEKEERELFEHLKEKYGK